MQKRRLFAVAAVSLVLVSFGILAFVRRIDAERPRLGVEWIDSDFGPLAGAVDPEGSGWKAGLRPGDLLLSVDGRPVSGELEAGSLPWEWGRGSGAALEVERGGQTRSMWVRPEWVPRTEPYGYLVLVGVAFFVSGAFIALRWPNVRGGRLYSMLAACMFVQLVLSHTGRADTLDWIVYWLDLTAGALSPALFIHFDLALSRRALPLNRWTLSAVYVPSALLVLASVAASGSASRGWPLPPDPAGVHELVERLLMLYLSIAIAVSIGVLVRSYNRSSSTLHRSQMRWLLWGLIVGLVPFATFYAVPFSMGASNLPAWAEFVSVLPMLIAPAAFTAALARYRLYDLSLLLRRALSEVTTVFFTFAVYAAAREASRGLFDSGSAPRYVGILVAAVAFTQLRRWVRAGVDRAFYRERYSYRATLLDWARDLTAETDFDRLLALLTQRVRDTLDLDEARVLVRTGERVFETVDAGGPRRKLDPSERLLAALEERSAVAVAAGSVRGIGWARWLFPMKVRGRLTAVLATDDRHAPDQPLSTEDRALLSTLAAHAATAIEAARLVREVRTRAEEIERLHARQERIVESSAVGLLLTDDEGRILAWNRALEASYGLPRQQAVGRVIDDVFPLHMVRRIEQEASAAPPGEQARIYRFTLVNRRGERAVVNLAITPTATRAGSRARVITFDDVSERVKLEEQVLRQERLASLGMLAAGVAHEVNTPLTGISGYTQLLLEDLPDDDPRRKTLGKIESQTQRAARIVNSLLNLSRPEETEFEVISLNETVRETLQLFEPQFRGRELRIETVLSEASTDVLGNKGKVQQVLLNLLINARDAVGPGGRIRVTTERWRNRVIAEIEDDGVGIAADDLPRIFDPFFTTKGRGKGTGLGLSISYGIVQEHSGELSVDSRPGSFTRFRLEFPAFASVGATA